MIFHTRAAPRDPGYCLLSIACRTLAASVYRQRRVARRDELQVCAHLRIPWGRLRHNAQGSLRAPAPHRPPAAPPRRRRARETGQGAERDTARRRSMAPSRAGRRASSARSCTSSPPARNAAASPCRRRSRHLLQPHRRRAVTVSSTALARPAPRRHR
jgi:hypothetical protein